MVSMCILPAAGISKGSCLSIERDRHLKGDFERLCSKAPNRSKLCFVRGSNHHHFISVRHNSLQQLSTFVIYMAFLFVAQN